MPALLPSCSPVCCCSNFDVLYVVDPHRSWYCGGDPALMEQRYGSRLRRYTQRYKHVVMVGDSMGATGALLFAPQATTVMAFCPQVRHMRTPECAAGWEWLGSRWGIHARGRITVQ
jgi:hypothetical protein